MFNRANQQSLAERLSAAHLVVAFNYQHPARHDEQVRPLRHGRLDLGGILTYRSGALIGVPASVSSNMGATPSRTRASTASTARIRSSSIPAATASIRTATPRC